MSNPSRSGAPTRHRTRIGWISTGAAAALSIGAILLTGCGSSNNTVTKAADLSGLPLRRASTAQVARGRDIVTSFGCVDCHSAGVDNPASSKWMAGFLGPAGHGLGTFQIGPFTTYAANLTPDVATGIGGFTDRQIFNALRFGLDPGGSPDAVISSTIPGQGNFPATPHYLAPPMPWMSIRHLPDADLWSLVAYLKHGIAPVNNAVPDSQGPPDFWASSYTDAAVGPATLPVYPTASEVYNP
jgi:hypothetical protein